MTYFMNSFLRKANETFVQLADGLRKANLSGAEIAGALSRPPTICSMIDLVLNNPDLEIADVVDMAMKNITTVDCANSGRRS